MPPFVKTREARPKAMKTSLKRVTPKKRVATNVL